MVAFQGRNDRTEHRQRTDAIEQDGRRQPVGKPLRRLAGYEAQSNTSGSADGAPLSNLQHVLTEPEILPVTPAAGFTDASTRPLEYRSQTLNFTVEIEQGTADWIWGGETTFRGQEECHMPIMKIPEFTAEGVTP